MNFLHRENKHFSFFDFLYCESKLDISSFQYDRFLTLSKSLPISASDNNNLLLKSAFIFIKCCVCGFISPNFSSDEEITHLLSEQNLLSKDYKYPNFFLTPVDPSHHIVNPYPLPNLGKSTLLLCPQNTVKLLHSSCLKDFLIDFAIWKKRSLNLTIPSLPNLKNNCPSDDYSTLFPFSTLFPIPISLPFKSESMFESELNSFKELVECLVLGYCKLPVFFLFPFLSFFFFFLSFFFFFILMEFHNFIKRIVMNL
jgi:hypothetical protein